MQLVADKPRELKPGAVSATLLVRVVRRVLLQARGESAGLVLVPAMARALVESTRAAAFLSRYAQTAPVLPREQEYRPVWRQPRKLQ